MRQQAGFFRLCLGAITIACLVAALPGWARDAAHDNGEPSGPIGSPIPLSALGKSAIGVQVQPVTRTSLPMEISVPGKIEVIPTRQFDEHAPLSGRVSSVAVWPGETVKQGQVLAVVDSLEMNQLAAELLQSKLDLESEQAKQKAGLDEEVRQAERRLELAAANRERVTKLYESKIAPQKDVQAANSEFDLAQTRLNTATKNREIVLSTLKSKQDLVLLPLRQRLKMLGVDENEIAAMLNKQKTITSVPVEAARSGVVTAISASAGKSIDPSVSLFTVADLSKVWATAEVYEDDMSRMKVGEPVHVKVHALAGEHVDGILTYIGSQVDPQTRTLPVRAEIDNHDLRLKPDMYADLFIQTAESVPMIALPKDAVIERGGHHVCFVERVNGFQPCYVKLGRSIGDMVEISEGLQPGERVVVRGAFQLAAQMVKDTNGDAMFSNPTESDRLDKGEDAKGGGGNLVLNGTTVVVVVAVAFLLGFAVSAIFLFRPKRVVAASHVEPPIASSGSNASQPDSAAVSADSTKAKSEG